MTKFGLKVWRNQIWEKITASQDFWRRGSVIRTLRP